ncbi:MAG: hypothetical protein HY865_11295 [Chloroflexi bacterium]|nr:hypothetical protein [Chloroflexota bacterium]
MSQRSGTGIKLFFLMTGVIITLACRVLFPAPSNTPISEPSPKTLESPFISQPTPTIRPTKIRTPLPSRTQIPAFPTDMGAYTADILNACTLVQTGEVAALFPNPPMPTNELKKESGYTISRCLYENDEMRLSISIASSPDFIDSLTEDLLNMKQVPLFVQFSASGANIYQASAPNGYTHVGVIFAAIIIKDNTAVKIIGSGKSYQYHAPRETLFVKALAGRLPRETIVFNACNLVTMDEVAELFPNPPKPINELHREEGTSYSTCSFLDDNMNLTLGVKLDAESARGLTESMQNLMKETPLVTEYFALGADIYQWGGPNDDTQIGEIFMAMIVKGDTIMEITGTGVSYQYDEDRETRFVSTIVGRLP